MTKLQRTARFFRQHRRRWVSALSLLRVGGALAWRTEVSRCRTDLGMRIEQRTDYTKAGIRSWYRYSGLEKNA